MRHRPVPHDPDVPRPATLALALALGVLALSACGKSAHEAQTVVGQAKDVAPLAAQGAVSLATRELIFDRQIAMILGEKLDDFKSLTVDSTAVKANSAWPTDAKILTGLLRRASASKACVLPVEGRRGKMRGGMWSRCDDRVIAKFQ